MTGYLLAVRPVTGGFRVTNLTDAGTGNVVTRFEAKKDGNVHLRRKLATGLYATEDEAGRVLAWLMGDGPFPRDLEPLPEHADDDTPSPFPVRLREARASALVTVAELAEAAGLTRQAVHNYEAGTRQPTWDAVQKLAAALGVPTDTFRDQ